MINNLKSVRIAAGLSQKELAERSNVNIRMIQYYEQGVKDINKAAGDTLHRLSAALNCRIEDLLEL